MTEEKKRLSVFGIISIVYFGCLALYVLGFLLCGTLGLEYRAVPNMLGKIGVFLGFPLWLLILLWNLFHGSNLGRNGKIPGRIGAIAAFILYLFWCYIFFVFLLFSTQEEKKLFRDYLAVNRAPALSETDYDICRVKGLFFREDATWDTAFETEYLEWKYQREFTEVPYDAEKMSAYVKSDTAVTETVPAEKQHQNLPISVVLTGGNLEDNYIEVLTAWYVEQGCRELGIERAHLLGDGEALLYFGGGEDIAQAASDARALMMYAAQDEIYRDFRGQLRFSLTLDSDTWDRIYLSFGKPGQWDDWEEGYYEDVSVLEEMIAEKYETLQENIESREEYQKEMLEETPEPHAEEEAESLEDEKTDVPEENAESESQYFRAARLIYHEELEPAGIGERITVDYNAKGQEYYPLGEDGEFSYTLVYDRDSKNGKCYLYVLYRSPYDEDNKCYYSYTSDMTQIMDIYAVVKGENKVIASGRTAWTDVGSREYREATGE